SAAGGGAPGAEGAGPHGGGPAVGNGATGACRGGGVTARRAEADGTHAPGGALRTRMRVSLTQRVSPDGERRIKDERRDEERRPAGTARARAAGGAGPDGVHRGGLVADDRAGAGARVPGGRAAGNDAFAPRCGDAGGERGAGGRWGHTRRPRRAVGTRDG